MVEQIVFFALGVALCGLLGLAFLPLVTARARRLTLALVEQRLPLSFDEIEAERDALRAKFATENRALEIEAEQARRQKAEIEIALGRRAVEELRLKEALAQKDVEILARDQQLAKLRAELESLKAAASEAETDQIDSNTLGALRAAIDDLGAKIAADPSAAPNSLN